MKISDDKPLDILRPNMRILQVVSSLSAGGAESFVTNLSIDLVKMKVSIHLFIMAGVRGERGNLLLKRLLDSGIEVSGIEDRRPASIKNFFKLTQLIHSWKPDIIHSHLYASDVACAISKILSLQIHTPLVRTLHSTNINDNHSKVVQRCLYNFFLLSIACSTPVANAYHIFLRHNRSKRLTTIDNGTQLHDFSTTENEKIKARKFLNLPQRGIIISHIGRIGGGGNSTLLAEPKAQDVLLEAFSRISYQDTPCYLVLVGDGPLRKEAESIAHSLRIEERVRFLGEQPEPWKALEASDIFCFPSRYEGLPLVLCEAASCGLPIIASDIPEIRNLCPNESWLLVPVDDVSCFTNALQKMLVNLNYYKQHAIDVAPIIRNTYSMSICAEKYYQTYISL